MISDRPSMTSNLMDHCRVCMGLQHPWRLNDVHVAVAHLDHGEDFFLGVLARGSIITVTTWPRLGLWTLPVRQCWVHLGVRTRRR